jgi:hypothetical protein
MPSAGRVQATPSTRPQAYARRPQPAKGDHSMRPLALTDDQLQTIQRHAEPLHPADRDAYLRRVAQLLDGIEPGDGIVSRMAARAAKEFFRPPALNHTPGSQSKYR